LSIGKIQQKSQAKIISRRMLVNAKSIMTPYYTIALGKSQVDNNFKPTIKQQYTLEIKARKKTQYTQKQKN